MMESRVHREEAGGAPLVALLVGMAAWAGWFIFRTSFVASGTRVFCLLEDAMISMTYARNLVEGHGLNWARAGTPVEGFTHPLWLALMVPVNALPGLDSRYRSLLIQLLSLAFLALNVVVVRRLTLRYFAAGPARHWMPAALLTAFYYPLDYWSLMGVESGLQALLTTVSVLLALDILDGGQNRHRALWLVATAAVLLRLDMILMVAVVQWFVLRGQAQQRRETSLRRAATPAEAARGWWRPAAGWWQGLGLCAISAGGYALFRGWYFGEALPNIWYLKLYRIPLEVRLMRGAVVLAEAWGEHLLLLACVVAGIAILVRYGGDRRHARRLMLPAALFLMACAYSVYMGGDSDEMDQGVRADRFVVYGMPLVFVLFNAIVNQVSARMAAWPAARRAAADPAPSPSPSETESQTVAGHAIAAPKIDLRRQYFVTLATILALVIADGLWLAADNAANWLSLTVASRPFKVKMHEEVYGKLRKLEAALPNLPGTLVATSSAGVPAYFGNYAMVDLLGQNERHIARLPPAMPLDPGDFMAYVPGYVKWDTAYVLHRYRPAAVFHPSGLDDPAPLLRAAGYRLVKDGGFWLRGAGPTEVR